MLKKSIAIFFLFTFLTSVTGYSVELHYCKGEITDVAFFGEASCVCKDHLQQDMPSNHSKCDKHCHQAENQTHSGQTGVHKKSCCKTEKISFSSHNLKALSTTKIVTVINLVAILHPAFVVNTLEHSTHQTPVYLKPQFSQDVLRLTRVLRI